MLIMLLCIDLRPGQTCHSKDGGSCIFCWRGRAWLIIWDRVKIPRYSHKLMRRKRVTCELHDNYFRLMMIKTCHSKDDGSNIFLCPFMGRGWMDVELLYNSVHRKFNQFGDQKSRRNDAVEKTAPSRELGPRAPGWAAQENGKETLMAIRVRVLFCLQLPLTHNPFKKSDRYIFLKNCVARLYCVVVMILYVYVFV